MLRTELRGQSWDEVVGVVVDVIFRMRLIFEISLISITLEPAYVRCSSLKTLSNW